MVFFVIDAMIFSKVPFCHEHLLAMAPMAFVQGCQNGLVASPVCAAKKKLRAHPHGMTHIVREVERSW